MNSFDRIIKKLDTSHHYSRTKSEEEKENIDIELISETQRALDQGNEQQSNLNIDLESQIQDVSIIRNQENGIKSQKLQNTLTNVESKKKICCWVLYNITGLCLILCNQMFISQKCKYSSDQMCQEKYFQKRMYLWVAQAFFNSAIMALWFFKSLKFDYQSPFNAFLCILAYLIIHMFGDQIGTRVYTGLVNKLQSIFFFIFLLIGLSIMIYKKFKRQKKIKFILIFCTALLLGLILILKISGSVQCNSWNIGINGKIEDMVTVKDEANLFTNFKPLENQPFCSILSPTFCWFYSLDNFLDISSYFPQYTCQNVNYSEKLFEEYVGLTRQHRYIGFPAQIDTQQKETNYQLMSLINIQGYHSIKEASKQGHEVILDKHNLKYHIQVIKNNTLSEERKNITLNKETQSIVDNILIVNVNGLSRVQMHAKLPKTVQWFKENNQNNKNTDESQIEKNNSNDNYNSLEFMRYNSFSHKKDTQSLQFFYGQGNITPSQNKLNSIFDFFKQEGYVTGYSNTFCESSSYQKQKKFKEFLNPLIKDHDSSSTFACDPNFEDPYQSFRWIKGSNSYFTRCLYGEEIQSYALNYTKSFFDKYNDNKKFFMLEFSEGRESTGQVVKKIDNQLFQFLQQNNDILQNTMIIIMSTQSQPNQKSIYSKLQLEADKISKQLPVLLMSLPNTLNTTYRRNLILNQQKLITIRNLHFTLKHIANGSNFNQKEESLLSVQQNFNQCPDLGISKNDCSCEYPIKY